MEGQQKSLIMKLLVCIVLATLLAACAGGNVDQAPADQGAQGGQEPVAVQQEVEETVTPGPVVLTFFDQIGGGISGIEDNPVTEEIARQTGVILDIIPSPSVERLNVMLAGRDLPDLLRCDSRIFGRQLHEGGLVMNLESLIQSNGPNILANASHMIEYVKQFESVVPGTIYHHNQ